MTPTDRLALCQAEAARFRRMAASCAAASRTEDRAEHAGTMAALAWLAAETAAKWQADAVEREQARWCQPEA